MKSDGWGNILLNAPPCPRSLGSLCLAQRPLAQDKLNSSIGSPSLKSALLQLGRFKVGGLQLAGELWALKSTHLKAAEVEKRAESPSSRRLAESHTPSSSLPSAHRRPAEKGASGKEAQTPTGACRPPLARPAPFRNAQPNPGHSPLLRFGGGAAWEGPRYALCGLGFITLVCRAESEFVLLAKGRAGVELKQGHTGRR